MTMAAYNRPTSNLFYNTPSRSFFGRKKTDQQEQVDKMEKDAETNKAEQAAEKVSQSEKLDNPEFNEGAASKEEEAMKKAMASEEEKKTEAASGSKDKK